MNHSKSIMSEGSSPRELHELEEMVLEQARQIQTLRMAIRDLRDIRFTIEDLSMRIDRLIDILDEEGENNVGINGYVE